MRRNTTPAITSQMYRHFAVVTVSITALLAFFANGQSQQAAAANAPVSQTSRTPLADAPKPKIVVESDSGSWGSDDGDSAASGAVASFDEGLPNPFNLTKSRNRLAGKNPDAAEDQDRDDAVAEPGPAPAPASPSDDQVAAAAAASRLRSGGH